MNRTTALLTSMLLPALAYANGWTEVPVGVWTNTEALWVKTFDANVDVEDLMDEELPPPRAEWCGTAGMLYQPTAVECREFDLDVEDWMLDYTGVTDVDDLPSYIDPPSYCGGC